MAELTAHILDELPKMRDEFTKKLAGLESLLRSDKTQRIDLPPLPTLRRTTFN
jgi:hypothetical protein